MSQLQQEYITALIDEYGLDLEGRQADGVVATWLEQYEASWIVKAIVEAVFRSVYKVKTVDGILKQWQRYGKPMCNFKPDFERERLKRCSANAEILEPTTAPKSPQLKAKQSELPTSSVPNCESLNPEELEPFHHHYQCGAIDRSTSQPQSPSSQLPSVAESFRSSPTVAESISIDRFESQPVVAPPPLETSHKFHPHVSQNRPQPPRLRLLDTLKRAISRTPPVPEAALAPEAVAGENRETDSNSFIDRLQEDERA